MLNFEVYSQSPSRDLRCERMFSLNMINTMLKNLSFEPSHSFLNIFNFYFTILFIKIINPCIPNNNLFGPISHIENKRQREAILSNGLFFPNIMQNFRISINIIIFTWIIIFMKPTLLDRILMHGETCINLLNLYIINIDISFHSCYSFQFVHFLLCRTLQS